MSTIIERAQRVDLPEVLHLLERHGLPVEGAAEIVDSMVVARQSGRLVGAAGVEFHPGGALLRSVVVDTAVQGQGLGKRLTEAALKLADARDAAPMFLLTTTAERFFPRFGFEIVGRDDVPASVQSSVEFVSACPASAVVMRRRASQTS